MYTSEVVKRRHRFHVGALILAVIIVFILFKVNLEKAINSPNFKANVAYIQKEANKNFLKLKEFFNVAGHVYINQDAIDEKIQPEKINNYFGVPTEENINKLIPPQDK